MEARGLPPAKTKKPKPSPEEQEAKELQRLVELEEGRTVREKVNKDLQTFYDRRRVKRVKLIVDGQEHWVLIEGRE